MRQNLDSNMDYGIRTINIPSKLEEYLDYGRNNDGWNAILDLDEFQEGIYLLDNTWQEVGNGIKVTIEKSADIERRIQEVNDKFDSLHKQAEKIKELIFDIGAMLGIKKMDAGVILRRLVDIKNQQLTDDLRVKVEILVGLLNEFIVDYEEWKIFKENNLEQLNEKLRVIGQSKLAKGGLKSNYPLSAGRVNRSVVGDGGWKWRNE